MYTTPDPPFPAEIVAGSEDLLNEILSHLPVLSLLRLKSVCKRWLSLISHPRFSLLQARRHAHHPASALFFLRHHHHRHPYPSFFSPSSSFDFIPLSPSPSPTFSPPFFSLLKSSPIDILQSCNGLLLCSSSRIFNPTTNQMASLTLPRRLILGINLAFDPSRSSHYQVVCVWKIDEKSFAIDVYSSGTNQWGPIVDLFEAPFDVEFERGVYCNGRIYWLSHTDGTVFFDLERECVENLRLPNAIEGAYIERFRYFGESCGHLHLIEIRTNCVPDFDVLELDRREKKEWFVKYRVNLDVLGRGFEAEMFQDHSDRFHRQFRFYAFSILAVVRGKEGDDDDGDSELVVSVPGKVISYNFKTMVSKLISNVVDESDRWLPFKGYNAYQFIESLYCL